MTSDDFRRIAVSLAVGSRDSQSAVSAAKSRRPQERGDWKIAGRPDRRHSLQFSRPTAGGLFRNVHRMRMLLAVKGSFAMINRIMPLTAPGHSQRTLSLQKEKAALNGPYNALGGSKWQPCRRSSLSAICQSPHLHLHILSGHHFRTQLHTQPRPRRQRKLSVNRRQRVGHDAAILIQVMPPDAFQDI